MARRLAGDSLAARIFPPFEPPSRPRATAWGFFSWAGASGVPVVCVMIQWATSLTSGSGLLRRLGIARVYQMVVSWRRRETLDGQDPSTYSPLRDADEYRSGRWSGPTPVEGGPRQGRTLGSLMRSDRPHRPVGYVGKSHGGYCPRSQCAVSGPPRGGRTRPLPARPWLQCRGTDAVEAW